MCLEYISSIRTEKWHTESTNKTCRTNRSRIGGNWTEMNECESKQLTMRWITTHKQEQIKWQRLWLKTDALNTNKHWRVSGRPMFAKVKYLVITELISANLSAWVFVMRRQMSCSRFLCFSSGFPCGLLKNQRTPQQLCCSIPTTPMQFQSSSIITMIVSQD